jgi:predicted site-specific integrase-resolvase
MNYKKKGLIKLIKLLCSHQIDRLVITHKGRLLRLATLTIVEKVTCSSQAI